MGLRATLVESRAAARENVSRGAKLLSRSVSERACENRHMERASGGGHWISPLPRAVHVHQPKATTSTNAGAG